MAGIAWVLDDAGSAPPGWIAALPPDAVRVTNRDSRQLMEEMAQQAACVMVDSHSPSAVALLRAAHDVDAVIQAIVVAPADDQPRMRREMLFTRGLGEVWVVEPDEVAQPLIERAAAVTVQRRRHRRTSGAVRHAVATMEAPVRRRTSITDAYLASLLEAAPDPILSMDADGVILSWNPGAERTLGYERGDAVGQHLAKLLHAPALSLPGPMGTGVQRLETPFRRGDGDTGLAECIIAPAEAAGKQIYAVLIHDVTEDRRTQDMLEAQASELEAQATELELQSRELEERAAELEKTNTLLLGRTRDMEQAAGARSRFYAAMSHELRTPINAIIGYNALVLEGIYGEVAEAQRGPIERSQRAAQHLLELINDVLDLSKIEAGRIELNAEPTWMPALVDELLDTVRPLASENGSDILVDGEGSHCIVTDARRVRQILLNLLSNAIKFGRGRPIVVAWKSADGGGLIIDVIDQGTGIEPANTARIFEEFTQVEAITGGGTGLGLPISRSLATLLGGSLSVSSEPDVGSTFTLTLPAVAPRSA